VATQAAFLLEIKSNMKRPTDDQILTALCCGPKCKVGPNTGYCHRWDFTTELTRVRALLDNMEEALCQNINSHPAATHTH
jgi:hypothetical protein